MNYPCEIIADLLPLYIDDICSDESRTAVENHLSECEKCRHYYEVMKVKYDFAENPNNDSEDIKMADSLKKVKSRINKKIRNMIVCTIGGVLMLALLFHVMFRMPLKEIAPNDVSVSAVVYPLDELPVGLEADHSSVHISLGEGDTSNPYMITIPAMPNASVSLTKNVMDKNKYATVISWGGKYFIKEVKWAKSPAESGDTLYVKSFRTTLFNNKTTGYTSQFELKTVNKIVYVDDNGSETVLWSR